MIDLDPLGLLAAHEGTRIRFGETDASVAFVRGTFSGALNQVESGNLILDRRLLPPEPVDYIAPLTVRGTRMRRRGLFTGHTVTASPQGDLIELAGRGATQLTDQILGPFAALDTASFEIVYLAARASGMAEDQLVIPEIESLPWEVFEVLSPVDGVALSHRRAIAGIKLLPAHELVPKLELMGFDEELLGPVRDAPAFALAMETSKLAFKAEQRGLARIDTAMGWLTTRARHALALSPDGKPAAYTRERALSLPRRRDLVIIRGLASGRRWLRVVDVQVRTAAFPLDEPDPLLSVFDQSAGVVAQLCVAACNRAASEREPFARLQAIWEAVELLVAGVAASKRFTTDDLEAIKNSLPPTLSEKQRDIAEKAVQGLNNTALLARLRELIEREALPCSDAEMNLLSGLRAVRNNVTHGRNATVPNREELDRAMAIVSRLVVHRLYHRYPWGKRRRR
jgi:hypothetical protein